MGAGLQWAGRVGWVGLYLPAKAITQLRRSFTLNTLIDLPPYPPWISPPQAGLQLLIDAKTVFHCHNTRWSAIYYSELGSSAAVLAAGFNLDSFMTRYQVGGPRGLGSQVSTSLA